MLLMLVLASCARQTSKDVSQETATGEFIECGYAPGEYACNITLFDNNSHKVSLHDYKGKTILLNFSTMWCYYCNVAAAEETELVNMYKDNGFEWVTVLVENRDGQQPSCNDLKSWADDYNIESPVLSGNKGALLDFENDGIDIGYRCAGYPTFIIINDELQIIEYVHGWSYDGIKSKLEEVIL